jgi:thioesterase domain-containing protein
LIFIHPSGGSVHWYTDLAKALGRDRPVYGFQMQGLQNGEGLHTRIEQMAQAYLLELRAFQPHGPYNLASWSMGVTIAYEMACQLAEDGEPVAFLGLLDQGPRLPDTEPEDDAEYLVQVFGEHVPVTVEELRQLPGEEQIPQVWKKARKAHFIYPEVSLEQFQGFIRALRTHTEAWRNYRPRPYPGKLTLFRAEDQDHLEDQADLGWGDLAAGGVQVYSVPGDHLTMIHPPHVKRLAEVMRACLDETSGVEADSTSPPVMEERPLDGSYEGRPG